MVEYCRLSVLLALNSRGASGAGRREETKKPDALISRDISAARLSQRDPEGFPPHPRGWLSIVVYLYCTTGNAAQMLKLRYSGAVLIMTARSC